MPRRRYGGKRKRVFKRKRFRSRKRGRKVRRYRRVGLPKTYRTSLKYVTQVLLDPGVGGLAATHVFSCNALNDPDVTGSGHQPRYYDQLMATYNKYRVVGARIRVAFTNLESTLPQLCGIRNNSASGPDGDENNYLEDKDCRWVQLNPTNGGNATKTLIGTWSARKDFGPDYMDEEYAGSGGGAPANQQYFQIWCAPTASSQNTNAVACTVEIIYRCIFSEQDTPAQS